MENKVYLISDKIHKIMFSKRNGLTSLEVEKLFKEIKSDIKDLKEEELEEIFHIVADFDIYTIESMGSLYNLIKNVNGRIKGDLTNLFGEDIKELKNKYSEVCYVNKITGKLLSMFEERIENIRRDGSGPKL